MQNINYYYDFSGQKFGYPLSLSINSFSKEIFSSHKYLEITYILKGEYEVVTENFTHIIKAYELVIIAPNDIHIIRQNSKDEGILLTIHIDFSLLPPAMIGEIEQTYESIICTNDKNSYLFRAIEIQIGKLFEFLLRDNNNLFELNTSMMELIYITSNHVQYPIERLPVQSIHKENYMKAIKYIDKHYKDELYLSDIANTLMFSVSYTSRLFKKYTGISFVKYVARVRIRKSIEDLLDGKKSIEQIAADCGMSNSKAYTKAFKEYYGILPSHYRKKFIFNTQLNELKKEHRVSIDDDKQKIFHEILEDARSTIYENYGAKIKVKDKHILCSIPCNKYVNSTISHCNNEIIIDIATN